jgi:hypothetical protein
MPLVRHPLMAWPVGFPATADPGVPATDPVPIPTNPEVTGSRRYAHDLDVRRGRSDHDHFTAAVIRLTRHDDAGAQCAADGQRDDKT